MKNIKIEDVYEVYPGNATDLVDIYDGEKIFRDIPFFDKDGKIITYCDAIEIYGIDGLNQDIWDDKKYLSFIEKYVNENDVEII